MASTAQVLANRANANFSTGPATEVGKARSSANATKSGLFSRRDVVPAESAHSYAELRETLLAQLQPQSRIEEVLTYEIISASWRLERCAQIEANSSSDAQPLDSPEPKAVERARTSAFRILNRALAELRTIQTNRNTYETVRCIEKGTSPIDLAEPLHALKGQTLDRQVKKHRYVTQLHRLPTPLLPSNKLQNEPIRQSTNQTQTPRTAPCPCGSGQKYKRCCGVGAAPFLTI